MMTIQTTTLALGTFVNLLHIVVCNIKYHIMWALLAQYFQQFTF